MKIAERCISDYLFHSRKLTLTLHCISVANEETFKEKSHILPKGTPSKTRAHLRRKEEVPFDINFPLKNQLWFIHCSSSSSSI